MQLAAPFYLHPAEHPEPWEALLAGELGLAFAVVDVFNGPGPADDPYYRPILGRGSATPLVGYVYLDYGNRGVFSVLEDVRRWREYYGITDVLLDGVPSSRRQGNWELSVIDLLRADGVGRVLTNPGTQPHQDLVRQADVTCVSENSWESPFQEPVPGLGAPDRLWHLIHSVPPSAYPAAVARVRAAGVGNVWITDDTMPNPWDRLPADYDRLRALVEATPS